MHLLFAFVALCCCSAAADLFRGRPELDSHWASFKIRHAKNYKNSTEEAARRKQWETTRNQTDKHNLEAAAEKHTYTMAENQFSDWYPEDMHILGGRVMYARWDWRSSDVDLSHHLPRSVPSSVDLRTSTCMSPVQDQGKCASCWAFGTTAAFEYRLCRKTGGKKAIKLSEQQLVDCNSYAFGCKGGNELSVWKHIQGAPGQASATGYPYISGKVGKQELCKYSSSKSVGTVKGYVGYLSKSNLTTVECVLASDGPVTAALHTVSSFYSYGSGVYSSTSCASDGTTVNHLVALVGYGTTKDVPYWIVRNSWGTGWGSNGYALIKRGVNMCNIESFISYPLV